jgi:hypothetical protein
VIIQTVEVKMIYTVVNYLFNGIDTRDVPWLLALILAITHVATTWLRNAFGKRAPARRQRQPDTGLRGRPSGAAGLHVGTANIVGRHVDIGDLDAE